MTRHFVISWVCGLAFSLSACGPSTSTDAASATATAPEPGVEAQAVAPPNAPPVEPPNVQPSQHVPDVVAPPAPSVEPVAAPIAAPIAPAPAHAAHAAHDTHMPAVAQAQVAQPVVAPTMNAPIALAATTPCGAKGQPACPLQGWMEQNLQQGLDNLDFALLARGFERTKAFVPDASWNAGEPSWVKASDAGLAAAKAGDEAGVRLACKSCHKAFRAKYKDAHRQRALTQ